MPQLVTYQAENFPPDIECQAVSFIRIEWPMPRDAQFEKHIWRNWQPTHVVMAEQGVLISYACVIRTTIEHDGYTYKVAGLSSVFTYPAFRRGGYGGKVVAAATQAIAISDADLGMLWCSPALEAFYAKSGWVSTTSETLVGDHSHPIIEDHGGYPTVRMV